MKHSLGRAAVLSVTVITAWSCGDVSAPPETVVTLTQVTGDGQSGIVGQPLAEPLVVRVSTANGQPVAGRSVIWSVTEGGGSVEPATSVTAADGTASTVWTLGRMVRTGRVRASVTGSEPVTFSVSPPPGSFDRVDDVVGPQVHVVYVVPADGTDRRLDLDGTLERSVSSFHNWFRQASGGFEIRFDTYDGDLDVGFHRLGSTDATMKSYGAFLVTEIEEDLAAAGLIEENKLYLIYYDGGSTYACGGAAWPPNVPGRAAAMYLKGTPSGVSCGAQGFVASASDFPRYWEFAALHDLVHTMGIVSMNAPNHTDLYPAHVPDRNDLMYTGPAHWIIDHTTVLDAGGDDYFGPTVPAGVPNLAQSGYLRAPAAGVIGRGPMTPLSPAAAAGLADALRRLPMHTPFTASRQD